MYIHAYQSYVWNAIVSERIRNFGCHSPIVGDLVFEKTPKMTTAEVPEQMDTADDVDAGDGLGEGEASGQGNGEEEAGVSCLLISWILTFLELLAPNRNVCK